MNGFTGAAAALLLASAPAWAINKCVGTDGKPVFQDAPCPGKGGQILVKPAMGDAPEPAARPADAGPKNSGQLLQQQLTQMQRDRRQRDLEAELPRAQLDLANLMAGCDRELDALKEKKRYANSNLAGATWEQSISVEMDVVFKRCEGRISTLKARVEAMRRECASLGGCGTGPTSSGSP